MTGGYFESWLERDDCSKLTKECGWNVGVS